MSIIHSITNFQDLVSTPFKGDTNALCWNRELEGDFAEIVAKLELDDNMAVIGIEELMALSLSEGGQRARETLLNDMKQLTEYGASPTLNVIEFYDRDDSFPFFPTDVYSFHVDRSPVPTDTFLCTYYGASSEIVPNSMADQKILVPEIRQELLNHYDGPEAGFDTFLSEHFFDLHYRAKPEAKPISIGTGNLWRLAVDFPGSPVQPCVHRAPIEKVGEKRLLLIC